MNGARLRKAGNILGITLLCSLVACSHPFSEAYDAANREAPVGDATGNLYPVAHVCPDRPGTRLYNTGGSTAASSAGSGWIPTPCETYIVKSAIDYCIRVTGRSDNIVNIVDRAESLSGSLVVLAATAAGVAGLVYGSTPATLGGSLTLLTALSGDMGKIGVGTAPTQPTPTTMWGAASSYAQVSQNVVVPNDYLEHSDNPLRRSNHQTNAYYAGLWNAAGTACPSSLIGGGFKLAAVDDREIMGAAWAPVPASTIVTVPLAAAPTQDTVVAQIVGALQANHLISSDFTVTQSGNIITITPNPAVANQMTLTIAVADSKGTKSTAESFALRYAPDGETTDLTISATKPAAGDVITITPTWFELVSAQGPLIPVSANPAPATSAPAPHS